MTHPRSPGASPTIAERLAPMAISEIEKMDPALASPPINPAIDAAARMLSVRNHGGERLIRRTVSTVLSPHLRHTVR